MMNRAFKTNYINTDHQEQFEGGTWKANGITNKDISKQFMSDEGEVVKISDATGNDWVRK
jgi:hypothetical protein